MSIGDAARLKRAMLDRFKHLTEKEYDYAKADFDDMDADGNGTLSFDEIKAAFEQAGDPISDDSLRELLKSVDKDQNGSIDFAEFCSLAATSLQKVASAAGAPAATPA